MATCVADAEIRRFTSAGEMVCHVHPLLRHGRSPLPIAGSAPSAGLRYHEDPEWRSDHRQTADGSAGRTKKVITDGNLC